MKPSIRSHIALGSNKGNKFENLQQAIDYIYERVGTVSAISKIYKTEALGFEGDDFFNACIAVQTQLAPLELLETLLDIEVILGRERTDNVGYTSRTIDLDIIFYDDSILDTETLVIPHPEAHKRNFVLHPLRDIAAKFKHPVLDKEIQELLIDCPDTTVPEPQNIWLKNPI